MVVRGQGVVVAELAELELLVAAVAEVAERSCAVSHAGVLMGYWVRDEKMVVDCNMTPLLRNSVPHESVSGECTRGGI